MPQTNQYSINIDDLFADIAHKFKTPLAVCLNNIELAQLKIADGQIAEAKQVLDRSFRSINALSFTCSQAIDDCRIDSFGQQNKQVFDLSSCTQQAIDDFKILLDGRKLIAKIEPNIKLCGHEVQITELILNILDNAVKFTDSERGKIELELKTSNFLTQKPNRHPDLNPTSVVLTIQDNGVGISKDHLAKIFDRNYQAEAKTSSAGLGLYLCQKIVKNHFGTIEIKSKVNKGTTVIINLPYN